MFHEYKCGCIWSIQQGRIRICDTHRLAPGTADGYGALAASAFKGQTKDYPANGQEVANWSGK